MLVASQSHLYEIIQHCPLRWGFVGPFHGITRVTASYTSALVVLLGGVWNHTLKWTLIHSFFN